MPPLLAGEAASTISPHRFAKSRPAPSRTTAREPRSLLQAASLSEGCQGGTAIKDDTPDLASRRAAVTQHITTCPSCQGSGKTGCKFCMGVGRLKRGGYNEKNRVDMTRIINSKWTAMETTMGWRHFQVKQQRKQGKMVYVLMQASCDAEVQLWVNAQNLKERSSWAAGWLQMAEMQGGAEALGAECRCCSGQGYVTCTACQGCGVPLLIDV